MAPRINTATVLAGIDLVELVGRTVQLRKAGKEWEGLCPFHVEQTPSFTVSDAKGFYHCFGCGAHGNAIGWLMQTQDVSFVEACRQLGHAEFRASLPIRPAPARPARRDVLWLPLVPVPNGAGPLVADDGSVTVWNPKRERWSTMRPTRVDRYRDDTGRLLGAVLRCDFTDRSSGKPIKITPQVTWCVGPDGAQCWCIRPFPSPRPLYGLDDLASKPDAPVLVVEGEKCRTAGADALPAYAVVAWPGGSKGLRHVDFGPLKDRDVVLWPDADQPGRDAMLGYTDYSGLLHDGAAQRAWRAGARRIRYVDVQGRPDGWDIADALDPAGDGWTPRQLAAWAAARVCDVEVATQAERRAA